MVTMYLLLIYTFHLWNICAQQQAPEDTAQTLTALVLLPPLPNICKWHAVICLVFFPNVCLRSNSESSFCLRASRDELAQSTEETMGGSFRNLSLGCRDTHKPVPRTQHENAMITIFYSCTFTKTDPVMLILAWPHFIQIFPFFCCRFSFCSDFTHLWKRVRGG